LIIEASLFVCRAAKLGSKLQSARRGHCMARIRTARQRYVCLKNINSVGRLCTDAVAVDIYSNGQKSLGSGGSLLFILSDLIFKQAPSTSKQCGH